MTAEEIFKKENRFFGKATINGIDCTIGYNKEFRWSWFATQLNTFVIVGETEQPIDAQLLESFSAACFEYAIKNHKGWPRGLQAGINSIAVLKGKTTDDARILAMNFSKKHFSAFEIPVVFDVEEQKAYRYLKAPVWGTIYYPYFSKRIDALAQELKD